MRGIYTAQYLASLADGFSKKSARKTLDVGSGFDLIVGTSTGAILACALAANIPLSRVVQFYNQKGAAIFERRIDVIAGLIENPHAVLAHFRGGCETAVIDRISDHLPDCEGRHFAAAFADQLILIEVHAVEGNEELF